MSFSLSGRGYSFVCRLPSFDELLAFEREQQKNEFSAMRALFKKCRESGDSEGMPAALEISFAAKVLEAAGSGATIRKVEDEDEYPTELAEAMVRLADRGPFIVFETRGVYLLTREPRNAEMEAFWKTRDKSQLAAARALVKGVTLFATGSPADAPMQVIEAEHPAVLAGLSVAISEVGGLTLDIELGKA